MHNLKALRSPAEICFTFLDSSVLSFHGHGHGPPSRSYRATIKTLVVFTEVIQNRLLRAPGQPLFARGICREGSLKSTSFCTNP